MVGQFGDIFSPVTRGAVVFVCHDAGCLVLDGLQFTDLAWSLGFQAMEAYPSLGRTRVW